MENILIWSRDGILKAAEISEVPKAFTFDGRWFDLSQFDLGDVDYLRNEQGQVVGFSYGLGHGEEKHSMTSCIVSQSNQCHVKDGFLFICVHPGSRFEIDVVQAIGTFIYYDNADSVILIVPYWGKREFAFDLTPDGAPVPCNL